MNRAKLFLLVLLVIVAAATVTISAYYDAQNRDYPARVETMESVFLDVDNDGDVDHVLRLEFVRNGPAPEPTYPPMPAPEEPVAEPAPAEEAALDPTPTPRTW